VLKPVVILIPIVLGIAHNVEDVDIEEFKVVSIRFVIEFLDLFLTSIDRIKGKQINDEGEYAL